MAKLPPNQDALLQHVDERAVYQAGIWTSSTNTQQASPHNYDWMKEPGTLTWYKHSASTSIST